MGILSLTRCLDVVLLVIILTPYATAFLSENPFDSKTFGKSFLSAFIFVSICFYYLYPSFWDARNFAVKLSFLPLSFLSAAGCFLLDVGMFKLCYGMVRVKKLNFKAPLLSLYLVFLLPVMEELLFRAYLFYVLDSLGASKVLFVILSSLSFALCHFIYSPINIFTKALWSLLLCWLFIKTSHSVGYTIVAHILSNLFLLSSDFFKRSRLEAER